MLIICPDPTYTYECEKICRVFFPTEKLEVRTGADPGGEGVAAAVTQAGETLTFSCRATLGGRSAQKSETAEAAALRISREMALARVILQVLGKLTGDWTHLELKTAFGIDKLLSPKTAREIFERDLMVRPDKAALALSVAKAEDAGVALSTPASFSLYVSIPFCPTRCAYCSFVSHSVASAKKLIPDYVRRTAEELAYTGGIARELGLRLETVYFGGGTPTSLSAEDLTALTDAVRASFDLSAVREFTVEAGRPDTVDEGKLRALKDAGVTRISINPQTFNDRVLEAIGRRHTAAETIEKFRLARALGFDNINMDLIAGLTDDTPASFRESVSTALALAPENITVHTLALKTAARLVTENARTESAAATAEMVETANRLLTGAGYAPYYMYRQSKSLGNLENVGWTKPGFDCLYNIYMMEEIHTVLAVGAGAVTKLRDPHSEELTRVYNFKYPYEYISRFDEMLARKNEVRTFYAQI